MVSSDSDLDLFSTRIDRARFRARLVREYSLVIESLIIYELLPESAEVDALIKPSPHRGEGGGDGGRDGAPIARPFACLLVGEGCARAAAGEA